MTPEKYLKVKKEDFFANGFANKISENQLNEFFGESITYIEKLKNVRHSKYLTEQIVSELINKCRSGNAREIVKYGFINHWITEAVWSDRTYYWARLRLGQFCNREAGMMLYNIDSDYMSESELLELLDTESNGSFRRKYIIENNMQMKQIYELLGEKIDCDYTTFREAIESANFNVLNIKRLNFMMYFAYRLSFLMGKEWYSDVCHSMAWDKSDCSKQNTKYEGQNISQKIDTLIKMKPNK